VGTTIIFAGLIWAMDATVGKKSIIDKMYFTCFILMINWKVHFIAAVEQV
jgi:hypothetical protein